MGNAAPPIERLREEPHCECNVRFYHCKRCAIPGYGHDFSSLSGDAWACVKRWGSFSDGICAT